MTAAVEAIDIDDDERYSNDSFPDDFESDSSSNPYHAVNMKETAGFDVRSASGGHAAAGASMPMGASSNSATFTSSSDTPRSARSSRNSSVLHSPTKGAVDLAGAGKGVSSTPLSTSALSCLSPSQQSPSPSRSAYSRADAAASEQGICPAYHSVYEDDSFALPADRVFDEQERLADGCVSEAHSRSGRFSADQRSAGDTCARMARYPGDSPREYVSTNVSVAEHCGLQRPGIPETAEELLMMQEENACLREELFQRSREHYHASLSQCIKGGSTFDGNRTIGGPGASHKSTATSTVGGTLRRHHEIAARLVQESLMAHRTLQVLRLEQRDLVKRRDELKELVRRYKKASKYKDFIKAAKQDIAILTEDHRDAHLEMRCNEKLLVMSDAMLDTGLGDRRLLEEVRSQNALTQRRREHALRDADSAQRVRDAAAQRVGELMWELEKRRQWAAGGSHAETHQLHLVNQAKRHRIQELRRQLQQLQQGFGEVRGAKDAHLRQDHASTQKYHVQHCHNKSDDAEREYLKKRIDEMRCELDTIASGLARVEDLQKASSGSAASLTSNPESGAPLPHSEASGKGLPASGVRYEGTSAATALHETGGAYSLVGEAAQAVPESAYGEIDVTAWLNTHSVSQSTGNEVMYARPSSHDAATIGIDYTVGSGMPAVDYTGEWNEAHTHPIATEAAAHPVSPAWLVAESDAGDLNVAPVQANMAPLPSRSYDALDDVEEDIIDEEEVGTDDRQVGPAAAPTQGDINLDDVLFRASGHLSANTAAAPPELEAGKSDDGPDWLNF
ncbi:conserved hypothetical protein [Leishmania braziliensis MHOM/BR/75/M2904]|uniref:Uncharacterized protein n=2 Tax=Leishmania braziliensis TaxID=5660 RepID=A4HKI2_LEIBR|nr:conserved hypothetical protein [Leishmania braziliensis MHOM/BR/75/M2904]CAJ2478658.1 unnamed protein product [Leishmania braziliensis]CAM43007.1 conserved hypothetical protein [Leishmania braziliensis MHOM/BR/75/M2904]